MRRYESVSSAFIGGTVPSIFGTTLAPDKSLSAKLQKKKDDSCRYSSHHLSLYRSFCPTYLNLLLTELKNASLARTTRSFFGTCLVIDLSGFTRLSADLCDQGATGIDELRQIISLYFGSFVEIITSMGGDVLYFAGDALITIFEKKCEGRVEWKDLDSTSLAVHCANRIHHFCSRTSHLSAHVAIEYGEINFSIIGGYLNQWVYVATGKCIDSMGNCLEEAESNQTVLSEAAYFQLTDPQIEVEKLQSGRYTIISPTIDSRSRSIFRTFSFHHPLSSLGSTVSAVSSPQRNSSITDEIQNSLSLFKNMKSKVPLSTYPQPTCPRTESQSIALASHIICFIPRPVLEGISLNLLNQLSEMRTVTTLFMKVDPSAFKDPCESISIHQFFYCMQECLADSGGYLRQFLFDDKGCVLIALWGVPTAAFANNCSRALRCAVVMSRQAKQYGWTLSIGISTGSVYCGTVGLAGVRQDYVAIGKSVNLAARLMSRANGRILLDDKTFGCLPLEIATLYISALPPFDFKGFSESCNIFWYSSNNLPPFVIRDTPADSSLVVERYILQCFGTIYSYLSSLREVVCSRESVGDALRNSYCHDDHHTKSGEAHVPPKSFLSDLTPGENNFFFGKRPYFFMIYGSPGMGKTAMATYLSRKYKCMGYNVTFVRASPVDESINFNILKKILIGLISLINENAFTNDLRLQREVITLILKKAFPTEDMISITRNRFPWIQEVLQLAWELALPEVGMRVPSSPHQQGRHGSQIENNQTITTFVRALIGMLQGNGSSGNVVIIDNAHFMCSSTWKEITKLVRLHCPLLVVLTFRIHEVGNLCELKMRNESLHEVDPNVPSSLARCASSFFLSTLQRRYEEQHGNSVEIARHSAEYGTLLSQLSSLNSSSLHLKHLNYQSFVKIFYNTFSAIDSNVSSRSCFNDHQTLKSVYHLSQGIPFWIWKIIKFLKFSGDPISNFDYRSFICCLLDKFPETEKTVLKCASVVGVEFHLDVLKRMIAPFLLPELEDILLSLVDSGLINFINGKLFFFRSSSIREYIYSLIPPSDAISLHLLAADTIEMNQSHEMTLYTPLLSYHYSMCSGKVNRRKAWNYTLRASILCLNSNLFQEAATLLRTLQNLKPSANDRISVLFVIDVGIGKIKQFYDSSEDEQFQHSLSLTLSSLSLLKSQLANCPPETLFHRLFGRCYLTQEFESISRGFFLMKSKRVAPHDLST